MMRKSLTRESSWALLDAEDASSDNLVSKRANGLKTLDEDLEASTMSLGPPKMDEAEFKSAPITPTPSDSGSKKSCRESMAKMSSWACLDLDELCVGDLCVGDFNL